MLFSQLLIPTLREAPAEAEVISHQLLIRAGMIRKLASGVYSYLPLALRTIRKIETIIREEMNAAGAAELLLPIVMPRELWEETGRWGIYGKELLRFKDRHDRDFCIGPTHEEAITDLVRNEVRSYRQLPLSLYQIQTKFRDEVRPRFGLMRGREFIMKDCYSFDLDEAGAKRTYQRMYDAYVKIFRRCGLTFKAVEAGTGNIGGNLSHEFQVLAQSGEDAILSCTGCDWGMNKEMATERSIAGQCPQCQKPLEEMRGIEVGQVFYLGTKYSQALRAVYLDQGGKEQVIEMGCYGIGVSRTAAAAIEQNHDEKGIVWPVPIAPFSVEVVCLNKGADESWQVAQQLQAQLSEAGIDAVVDDRDLTPGVKFKDADLIGIPYQVVVGPKGLAKGEVEIKERKSGVAVGVVKDQVAGWIRQKII